MTPRLYTSLAGWWQLLSPASDYREEAEVYRKLLNPGTGRQTLLELGAGGGNNASFLKQHFAVTLTDLSPEMLAQSRALNPECEHIQGDMRTLRLGRAFDRVFIHDAICYMTTHDDLRRAVETAFVHCRPGGIALFVPDLIRETFSPGTDHGGCDGADRGLRYLEWTWDPDPADSTYVVELVYAMRDAAGLVTIEHDRHVEGLFSRDEWLRILHEAGFEARIELLHLADMERPLELFLAVKPA